MLSTRPLNFRIATTGMESARVAFFWRCPTSNRKCPARAATTDDNQPESRIFERSRSNARVLKVPVSPRGLEVRSAPLG